MPPDPPPRDAAPPGEAQGALFDGLSSGAFDDARSDDRLRRHDRAHPGYAEQLARVDARREPGRFRLLVAAESAGALLAAEMGHDGLPWSEQHHDEVLLDLLGEPSPVGGAPRKLVELAEEIAVAFGGVRLHPESPAEVLRAFHRAGIR